jgi:hypothetical protein
MKRRAHHKPVLTDLDIFSALAPHRQSIRTAMMLTLTSDLSPEEIVELSWKTIRKRTLNKGSTMLINSLPRHIFYDRVFWDTSGNETVPLSDLCEAVAKLTGEYSLEEFREQYRKIICVSDSSREFIKEISRSLFYRL